MRNSSVPDWNAVLLNLQETLESVLDQMEEDARCGVRADVRCLTAHDTLNQYMKTIEMELGL